MQISIKKHASCLDLNHTLKVAAGIGGFISLFLILFRPFGMSISLLDPQILALLCYGIVTGAVILFNEIILYPAWKKLWRSKSNVRAITTAWVGIYYLIMLLGNWLTHHALSQTSPQWTTLVSFSGYVAAIGIFPVLFFFLHNRKGRRVTTEMPAHQATAATDVVVLRSLVGNDRLQVKTTDLLFLRAEGNYVIATYRYEDKTRDFVFRHSLKALQEEMNAPSILRCHRSYMINLDCIERVTGNSQGLTLLIEGRSIPVSRSYVPLIKDKL